MNFRFSKTPLNILIIICTLQFTACSNESDALTYSNLQEYLHLNSNLELDEVIACAASDQTNKNITYIFYYPVPNATEIQYFETSSLAVNENNFSEYLQVTYNTEPVFNGYLGQFVRNNNKEVWCMVTYKTNGKLHKCEHCR